MEMNIGNKNKYDKYIVTILYSIWYKFKYTLQRSEMLHLM